MNSGNEHSRQMVQGFQGYNMQQTNPHPSSNWFFDNGASTHVTHDLRNITQPLSFSTNDGVVVGNGSTLPINHTGQYNTSNPSQGAMCSGLIPHSDLLL